MVFLFNTILGDSMLVWKLVASLIVKTVNMVKPLVKSTTTKHALFFPGKISMTSQSGRLLKQVSCVYSGIVMHSNQLVFWISSDKCLQSFAKSKLTSISGDHLKGNDYICFYHEERRWIKYKRSLDFTIRLLLFFCFKKIRIKKYNNI